MKIRVKEKRTSSIWEHEKEKWATKNQRTPKKNDISRGKLDNLRERERELVSQVFAVFFAWIERTKTLLYLLFHDCGFVGISN